MSPDANTSPTVHFMAPPGWPSAPAGLVPTREWRPEAGWPAAPIGWHFYVDDRGMPVLPPAGAWQPDPPTGMDAAQRAGDLIGRGIRSATTGATIGRERMRDSWRAGLQAARASAAPASAPASAGPSPTIPSPTIPSPTIPSTAEVQGSGAALAEAPVAGMGTGIATPGAGPQPPAAKVPKEALTSISQRVVSPVVGAAGATAASVKDSRAALAHRMEGRQQRRTELSRKPPHIWAAAAAAVVSAMSLAALLTQSLRHLRQQAANALDVSGLHVPGGRLLMKLMGATNDAVDSIVLVLAILAAGSAVCGLLIGWRMLVGRGHARWGALALTCLAIPLAVGWRGVPMILCAASGIVCVVLGLLPGSTTYYRRHRAWRLQAAANQQVVPTAPIQHLG